MTKTKILAIDPGIRQMGIAFLDNGKLIYHGVKSIKNRKSPAEVLNEGRKIILRLIKDFKPDMLVIEKTYFANNACSYLLNAFVNEMGMIGKKQGLKVLSFAPNTVKKFICGNGRASKKELAKVIAFKYPELRVYLNQDKEWKEKYHQNMFDAVGLAEVAVKRQNLFKIKT